MSMKLVILGLLMESESHPYVIRQKMIEREMHHFVKMRDGSLYYAIDTLKKDGFIETVEKVKDSARPDRTIYRITSKGEQLFHKLLLEQFENQTQLFHPMGPALIFSLYGNQDDICRILRKKLEEQKLKVQQMKDLYEEHVPIVPRGVLHMMWGAYEHAETHLRWLERLVKDAEAGLLKERGVPLDL
ncbi:MULTISPECIES: PadR family transcriptional regulator [unclassified Paenibacillus]|uniref:PadR family transcriptional regulator n=1 Tax=unclassified Paenibacillus TaxID=185978 RepID=UPI003644B842